MVFFLPFICSPKCPRVMILDCWFSPFVFVYIHFRDWMVCEWWHSTWLSEHIRTMSLSPWLIHPPADSWSGKNEISYGKSNFCFIGFFLAYVSLFSTSHNNTKLPDGYSNTRAWRSLDGRRKKKMKCEWCSDAIILNLFRASSFFLPAFDVANYYVK